MSLDDQIRQSASALATELGRDIQQALDRFLDQVLAQAAQERDAVRAELEEARATAESRLEEATSRARADAEAERERALSALREESAVRLAAAIAETREEAAREAAFELSQAREETAAVAARLQAHEDAQLAEAEQVSFVRETSEREATLAGLERLVESFRMLDAAGSLTSLLDALAAGAARDAARTAVFVVRGGELRGWRVYGFDDTPEDARSLSVDLETAGPLAECARTRGRVEVHGPGFSGADALGFLALPAETVGVAIPVVVGGVAAAIVYADDGAAPSRVVPSGWPETLELLARHAARCVEAQTAIRAARLGSVAPAGALHAADTRIERAPAAVGHRAS